jgi:hypothetical protein
MQVRPVALQVVAFSKNGVMQVRPVALQGSVVAFSKNGVMQVRLRVRVSVLPSRTLGVQRGLLKGEMGRMTITHTH